VNEGVGELKVEEEVEVKEEDEGEEIVEVVEAIVGELLEIVLVVEEVEAEVSNDSLSTVESTGGSKGLEVGAAMRTMRVFRPVRGPLEGPGEDEESLRVTVNRARRC
jgi:hypothetical protein